MESFATSFDFRVPVRVELYHLYAAQISSYNLFKIKAFEQVSTDRNYINKIKWLNPIYSSFLFQRSLIE